MTAVVLLVAGAAGCNGIEADEPLGQQIGADDRDEFVTGFMEGTGGTVSRGEAECMADTILGSDLTPRNLSDAQSDPDVADELLDDDALLSCIDPDLELSVPIEGELREQLATDFEAIGFDSAGADCVLDGVTAAGFDARDFLLSGLGVPGTDEFDGVMADLTATCG